MYIEPNSTVKVLKGIPWDNTYQHTARFKNRDEQTNYMSSKVAHTLGKHTYVREGRGYLKVEKNVEELIGCNYLMFQNPKPDGTMGRVFYAFITATEYVNPVTTEIRYEIDVLQTWFLDCKMGQCFIERSHSAADYIGYNTVPEDVSIGDYICTGQKELTSGVGWSLCAVSSMMWHPDWGESGEWDEKHTFTPVAGLPSGMAYHFVDLEPTRQHNGLSDGYSYVYKWDDDIDKLIDENPGALLALIVMPRYFFGDNYGSDFDGNHKTKVLSTRVYLEENKCFEGHGADIKNKKMFTFPYCCVELTNNQGNKAQYKYEYFDNTLGAPISAGFRIMGDVSPDPTMIVAPVFYAGKDVNIDSAIALSDFPFIAYTNDVYKQWLATHKNQVEVAYDKAYFNENMSLVNGAVSMAGNAIAGNAVGTVQSAVNTYKNMEMAHNEVRSLMAKEADLKAMPATPVGSKGSTLLMANRVFGIWANNISLRWVNAKRIDDYFSVYGYAVRSIGTPNIDSRPSWNYIKLANANITPINDGVPADDVSAIVKILSNGITFWHNANKLGDYSQDNSV